ncbi:MAG TPA: hypothetical protein VN648_06240, partial [Candidatus Methylomirabilis sp.]|nr:hypothetical protein [Candidatus Methylomirabilis sp.]
MSWSTSGDGAARSTALAETSMSRRRRARLLPIKKNAAGGLDLRGVLGVVRPCEPTNFGKHRRFLKLGQAVNPYFEPFFIVCPYVQDTTRAP